MDWPLRRVKEHISKATGIQANCQQLLRGRQLLAPDEQPLVCFGLVGPRVELDLLRRSPEQATGHPAGRAPGERGSQGRSPTPNASPRLLVETCTWLQHAAVLNEEIGLPVEMVLVAIEQDPDCLELIEDTWRADREVMLACVSRAPERLALAAATLQEQTDVVLKAIFTDSEALQFASEAMRGCKRVVLKAQEIRRPFVSLLKLCEMTLRRLLDPRCTSGGPSNGGSAAYFKPCGMQERHCSTHLTSVTGQWT
eukprot:s15_g19.t1